MNYYSLIADVVLVAIIVISMVIMSRKGILKSLYKIFSIVLTIIAVMLLAEPVENTIEKSGLGLKIDQVVYDALISERKYDAQADKISGGDQNENIEGLATYVTSAVEEATTNAMVPAISNIVKKLISAIIIFLLAKLILYLIFLVLDGLFKLPLLKSVNSILGAFAGLLSSVVIIYILCGIASLNVAQSAYIREIVDNTFIVKYFYDGNILMNLFISM